MEVEAAPSSGTNLEGLGEENVEVEPVLDLPGGSTNLEGVTQTNVQVEAAPSSGTNLEGIGEENVEVHLPGLMDTNGEVPSGGKDLIEIMAV